MTNWFSHWDEWPVITEGEVTVTDNNAYAFEPITDEEINALFGVVDGSGSDIAAEGKE